MIMMVEKDFHRNWGQVSQISSLSSTSEFKSNEIEAARITRIIHKFRRQHPPKHAEYVLIFSSRPDLLSDPPSSTSHDQKEIY